MPVCYQVRYMQIGQNSFIMSCFGMIFKEISKGLHFIGPPCDLIRKCFYRITHTRVKSWNWVKMFSVIRSKLKFTRLCKTLWLVFQIAGAESRR